jgi:hypothetical protein
MYSHNHEKINIGPEGEKFTLKIGVKLGNQISAELFILYWNIYWKDLTGATYSSLISAAKIWQMRFEAEIVFLANSNWEL